MPDTSKIVEQDPSLEASDDSDEDYDPSSANKSRENNQEDVESGQSESDAEDKLGDYDSGDEKTIGATIPSKKRKRNTSEKNKDVGVDELGTDGGLVKTRAQRAQEQVEDSKAASIAPVQATSTTSVDALWAAMNAPPARRPIAPNQLQSPNATNATSTETKSKEAETVTISRTYKFAGQLHTEEKVVPKDSQSARDFLADREQQQPPSNPDSNIQINPQTGLRRVMKRKSTLEQLHGSQIPRKLNTLEKSRIEWSGFVDEQGISDELKRGNQVGFLDKQDFLGRSERAGYDAWKAGQKK